MSFHIPMAISLLVTLGWTVLFSMANTPGVRGYRNLGILASYICLIVFFFRAGWKGAGLTWLAFAAAGGLVYTGWEVLQRLRTPKDKAMPKVGFMHVFPAIALWPIMVPEALEYALAELGVLKAQT